MPQGSGTFGAAFKIKAGSTIVFSFTAGGIKYWEAVKWDGTVLAGPGIIPEDVVNTALATLGEGAKLILLEDDYTQVAGPFAYQAAKQVIEGMGDGSHIDSTATGLDAVKNTGYDECELRHVSMTGGIDFDSCDDFKIRDVFFNDTFTRSIYVHGCQGGLIENITIEDAAIAAESIYLLNSDNLNVVNVRFYDDVTATITYLLRAVNCDNLKISESIIASDIIGTALTIDSCNLAQVNGNTISGGEYCLFIDGSFRGLFEDNTIYDHATSVNLIDATDSGGIIIGDNILLNLIENTTTGGIYIHDGCDRARVYDNYIYLEATTGTRPYGIQVLSEQVDVHDNKVFGQEDVTDGIAVGEGGGGVGEDTCNVHDNWVFSCTNGITANGLNVSVYDNVVLSCTTGIRVGDWGVLDSSNSAVKGNHVYDCTTGIRIYANADNVSVEINDLISCTTGIQIDATATGTYIDVNYYYSVATPVVDNGTNTLKHWDTATGDIAEPALTPIWDGFRQKVTYTDYTPDRVVLWVWDLTNTKWHGVELL